MSSVINETLLAIKSAFEAGVNIFNGGTAVSSSNPLPVNIIGGGSATITNRSSTITTGSTAQVLMAANANRKSYWIQNQSAYSLWINRFGSTATLGSPSLEIKAGAYFETPVNSCGLAAVSIIGSVTGQAFACGEGE